MNDPPTNHYFTSPSKPPSKIKKIFVSVGNQTLSLQTAPNVFSPISLDNGTRILLDNIITPTFNTNFILDLGAGYGPISIWLSKFYELQNQINRDHPTTPKIFASEINERAIWLLNRNIIANNCKNIEVLKGDFEGWDIYLKESEIKFDVIYSNPPLKVGHEKLLKIFDLAMKNLQSHGFILYVHKKKLGAPGFYKKMQNLRPKWKSGIYKKSGGYHLIVFAPEELPFKKQQVRSSGYF